MQVQLLENLGQGGSAFLACHWEESDSVIQEMFSSVRITTMLSKQARFTDASCFRLAG